MVEDSIEKYMWFWIKVSVCVCVSAPNSVMKIDVCVPFLYHGNTIFFVHFKNFYSYYLRVGIYSYVRRWVYLTSLQGKTWQNKNSEVYCF